MPVSFHKDHGRIADDQSPEPRWRGQNTKRDEEITHMLSRIVVAEQWFCCLWGLICMICGVYVLFVSFDQDSPFASIRWLGLVQEPILQSTAIACFVVGVVLVRCGLAGPGQWLVSIGQEPLRSARAYLVRAWNLFSAGGKALGFGSEWNGKEHYERRTR
jgi:hypothetical protein